jgi:DNA-directed RNA polymerase subunit RPC12/RpoP
VHWKEATMSDHEEARQWRDVAGGTVLVCEHCGAVVEPGQVRIIAPADRLTSGGADAVTACPDCWSKIERGEFEAFPAEEIDPD